MVRLEQPRVPLETPQPSFVRLPRHPGPAGRPVKCKGKRGDGECGQMLGITDGAYLFVRHEGRELVSGLPCHVRCDRCGGWQTIEG